MNFILIFIVFFLSTNLNANLLNKLLTELKNHSPHLKELEYRLYSNNELNNIVQDKYSYEIFLDANYAKQDGGITGNFFLDNIENSTFTAGLRKKIPYGLSFELSHTLNNNSLTSNVLGFSNQTIYFPVTSFALKVDLLKNFLGSKDSLELDNSILKQEKNTISLAANIQNYYLNVLHIFLRTKALKDQIHVAKTLLNSSETLLKVVNRKFNIGATERRYKIFAESNKIQAQETLLASDRAYRLSLYNLNSISGVDLSNFLDQDIEYTYIKSILNKLASYNTNNFDIKLLSLENKITQNDLSYSKRNTLPDLSLISSYAFGGLGNTFSDSFNSFPNKASFIGLSFIWNIENIASKSIERSSLLYLESIKYSLINLNYGLDNELEALKVAVASYDAQLSLAREKFEKNKSRYELELKSFDLGRSTFTELIDAQRAAAISEAELNNIKYELLIAIINTTYKKGVLAMVFEVN